MRLWEISTPVEAVNSQIVKVIDQLQRLAKRDRRRAIASAQRYVRWIKRLPIQDPDDAAQRDFMIEMIGEFIVSVMVGESGLYTETSLTEAINLAPDKTRMLFDLDLKADCGEITPQEIKEFGRWLYRNRFQYITLYHGTSAKHDILGQGLLPTSGKRRRSIQSGSGYVYLTYDPGRAESFARHGYPMEDEFVIYAVNVPIRALKPDKDQLFNKRMWGEKKDIGDTLADSFIYGGGARYKGAIEPYNIWVYKRVKR